MTEPRRFRLDYKPSSVVPDGLMAFQASVYARAIRDHYRYNLPLPPGDYTLDYAELDAAFTLGWWQKFHGQPVLVNKLRAKGDQIVYLNDMIRPETLARMKRPMR